MVLKQLLQRWTENFYTASRNMRNAVFIELVSHLIGDYKLLELVLYPATA